MSGLRTFHDEMTCAVFFERDCDCDCGLTAAVEAIVQRAVNEALTEAADAIDLRSDLFAESANDLPTEMRDERVRHNAMASGLNNAARIVRSRT